MGILSPFFPFPRIHGMVASREGTMGMRAREAWTRIGLGFRPARAPL